MSLWKSSRKTPRSSPWHGADAALVGVRTTVPPRVPCAGAVQLIPSLSNNPASPNPIVVI